MKLPSVTRIEWPQAHRFIRVPTACVSIFDDIASPEDWTRLAFAERKTDPRLSESVGNIDLVAEAHRVEDETGVLMSPFTHISYDLPSRFSTGRYGVLYAANSMEAALLQTVHHQERFLKATGEAAGWISSCQEITLSVSADLHDLRDPDFSAWLDSENYAGAQGVAEPLHASGAHGIVYPSTRWPGGECVALFYPDLAANPRLGRFYDLHWNGAAIDYVREHETDTVFRIDRT